MIGKQVANYRIEAKLGEGGMGVVYRAVDVTLDRPVALKLLSADLAQDPDVIERFRAEAKAQANLNHTNIATLYSFLQVEGHSLIVMEYVDGETFEQMIRRRGPIPQEEAVPLFKQALLGIGFAHRMGIIHRDIKPGNLMVNRHGIAKVMDFGIAKLLGGRRLTRTGMHVGTVFYMSPEQIRTARVDIRSDIYSLGVTLYEMLSGHVPFDSDSDFQVMSDHVNTPPTPPTRFYPYIPRGIEQAVLRALEKDPDARFQTVEEFGSALEHTDAVPQFGTGRLAAGPAAEHTAPVRNPGPPTVAASLAPSGLAGFWTPKRRLAALGAGSIALGLAVLLLFSQPSHSPAPRDLAKADLPVARDTAPEFRSPEHEAPISPSPLQPPGNLNRASGGGRGKNARPSSLETPEAKNPPEAKENPPGTLGDQQDSTRTTAPISPGAATVHRANESLAFDWASLEGVSFYGENNDHTRTLRVAVQYKMTQNVNGTPSLERHVSTVWNQGYKDRFRDEYRTVLDPTGNSHEYFQRTSLDRSIPGLSWETSVTGAEWRVTLDSQSGHRSSTAALTPGALPAELMDGAIAALPDPLPESVYISFFEWDSTLTARVIPVRIDFGQRGVLEVPVAKFGGECGPRTSVDHRKLPVVWVTQTSGAQRNVYPVLASHPHVIANVKCVSLQAPAARSLPRIDSAARASSSARADGVDIPSLNAQVTAMRFYEGGDPGPTTAQRSYATTFDAATTRSIWVELSLSFPQPGRQLETPVACTYFRADGTVLGQPRWNISIQPAWTTSWSWGSVGWATPGRWNPGAYRVECRADGRVVVQNSFLIR